MARRPNGYNPRTYWERRLSSRQRQLQPVLQPTTLPPAGPSTGPPIRPPTGLQMNTQPMASGRHIVAVPGSSQLRNGFCQVKDKYGQQQECGAVVATGMRQPGISHRCALNLGMEILSASPEASARAAQSWVPGGPFDVVGVAKVEVHSRIRYGRRRWATMEFLVWKERPKQQPISKDFYFDELIASAYVGNRRRLAENRRSLSRQSVASGSNTERPDIAASLPAQLATVIEHIETVEPCAREHEATALEGVFAPDLAPGTALPQEYKGQDKGKGLATDHNLPTLENCLRGDKGRSSPGRDNDLPDEKNDVTSHAFGNFIDIDMLPYPNDVQTGDPSTSHTVELERVSHRPPSSTLEGASLLNNLFTDNGFARLPQQDSVFDNPATHNSVLDNSSNWNTFYSTLPLTSPNEGAVSSLITPEFDINWSNVIPSENIGNIHKASRPDIGNYDDENDHQLLSPNDECSTCFGQSLRSNGLLPP